MVLLLVVALMGELVTFAMLLPYGMLVALVGAPFGGIFLYFMAGLFLAFLRTRAERSVEPVSDTLTANHVTRSITR